MTKKAQPFLMTILELEDATSKKRGSTATGLIQSGSVLKGETVQVVNLQNAKVETQIKEFELLEPIAENSSAIHAKIILRDALDLNEFSDSWIISPPNAITCHSSFLAEVTFLSPEQGGRSKPIAFVIGYAPVFHYEVILNMHGLTFLCRPHHSEPANVDYMEVKPGETASLLFPVGRYIPLEKGYKFYLSEGRKIVATGAVTELY